MATQELICAVKALHVDKATIYAVEALPNDAIDEPLPKAKKVTKAKKKNPHAHPRYINMVTDAIVTLKERNGSSHYAIAKHIEGKHKQLPSSFKKLLSIQLKKLVASGKLVKVKNSFKLPYVAARSKESKSVAAAAPTEKSAKPVQKTKVAIIKAYLIDEPAPKSKFASVKAKPDSKDKLAPKPKAVAKVKTSAPKSTRKKTTVKKGKN